MAPLRDLINLQLLFLVRIPIKTFKVGWAHSIPLFVTHMGSRQVVEPVHDFIGSG
jgi:hypothetical protein